MTARLLDAGDEPVFQRLLAAVYGDTYAYRELYAPGGYAALVSRGDVHAWGDVADDGELHSHTAFLEKDPRGEYVESGLSLRNPTLRSDGRTPDDVVWSLLLDHARSLAPLLHQNTTTHHPLAQRYARRHMGARPTGFIADYVVGERIVGMPAAEGPMQALTMTSVLREGPSTRAVRAPLPPTPYGRWLTALLGAWGVETSPAEPSRDDVALDTFEENRAIGLRRRVVLRRAAAREVGDGRTQARTELIHVPCDERLSMLGVLSQQGYVPVGVRPHVERPTEVVLQRIDPAERAAVKARLASASLVGEAKALVAAWCEVP